MNPNPTKKEKNQSISVYVRVRPLNKLEITSCSPNIVDIRGKELTVRNNVTEKHHKSFVFDKVFGPESQQLDVFRTVAEPAVAEIIAGYNCTIFAYGQTGTGKTYTMAGGNVSQITEVTSWKEEKHAGIIPRTLSYLFDELRVQHIEHTVRVSYLELYNEELFDLLSPVEDATKLKLYDDVNKKGSVIVAGQTEVSVSSKGEIYKILEAGAEKRRTATTLMNAQSSRSHTIFSVTIHIKESAIDGEDLLKTGKLNLVDLAGSENINKSGVTDKRARESSMINTSLLTLGRCIMSLTEHRGHIPYRESKLTRLLRDSLGGRTKTSLIATVSPALCNLEETLNTLDYASRAKHITNKPEMNIRFTKTALLKDYEDQIAKLQRDLQATRLCNGIYVAADNYDEMLKELQFQKQEIGDKINNIRALKMEMDEKEQICQGLQIEINFHKEVVEEKSKKIEELETKLDVASSEITTLKTETEEKEFLVAKHSEQEQILHVTAIKLLNTAESSTSDVEKLHSKLDLIADLNKQNKLAYEHHINEFNNKINQIQGKSSNFHSQQNKFHQLLADFTNEMKIKQNDFCETHCKLLSAYSEFISSIQGETENIFTNQSKINLLITSSKEQLLNKNNDNKQTVQDDLDQKLIPTFEQMTIYLNNHAQITEQIINKFNQLITENAIYISQNVDDLNTEINMAKNEVVDKLETTKNTVSRVFHYVLTTLLNEDEILKKAEQQMDAVMRLLSDTGNTLANRRKVNKINCHNATSNLSKITTDLEECRSDIYSLVQTTIEQTAYINDNLDSTAYDADLLTQSANREIEQGLHLGKAHHHSVHTSTNALVEKIKEQFDEECNANNQVLDELKTMITSTTNDTDCFMTELKTKLQHQSELHGNVDTENREYYKQSYNTIDSQVFDNKSKCSQYESHTMTALDDCRENVKKLFTTHIKEYKPTGYTPIRKKYKYPKSVPPTTCSEALLEDFRKTKLDIPEDTEIETGNDTENTDPNIVEKHNEKSISDKIDENSGEAVIMKKALSTSGGNIPVLKRK